MTASPDQSFPADAADRHTGLAMRRGALRRCPACGEGALFSGYLKVRDACPNCHETMHHHRADDGPAYITVLVVSHLLTPILLITYIAWRPSAAVMLGVFLLAAAVLSLAMLPVVKGAFVGLQWARQMHGFGAGEAGVW